jgi:hypothetical protein
MKSEYIVIENLISVRQQSWNGQGDMRSTFSQLEDIGRRAWPAPRSYRGSELQMDLKHPWRSIGITEDQADSHSRAPDYKSNTT